MAETLLLPPPPVESHVRQPLQHAFTSAVAREMASKSRIAREENIQKRIREAVEVALRDERAKVASENLAKTVEHPKIRLLRIRTELDRLDALLSKTTDGKELQAIATTIHKLTEIERVLDGRPLPGQLRPFQARAPKKGADTTPGPVE